MERPDIALSMSRAGEIGGCRRLLLAIVVRLYEPAGISKLPRITRGSVSTGAASCEWCSHSLPFRCQLAFATAKSYLTKSAQYPTGLQIR
jgi:hypothetical protein